ncbi:redoxin domain-containing protein [Basidiobolus meristosporus CBS 931.73]|uniref:Thioredoxin-dependent peroxiredoxin n=1 Tax=Basidiobolus meristosporus CBS 931.73 TaxID=1314790 RepID=A0A1Y1YXC8_9FUNG|nr:redoxin domain-containing protein [Basidiobolus meristosporus CBS 931.73]|eukprot:ORY02698.1 redoxin domain-containing protein [Basidiobolus meristosporus CBS 931.73]
MTIQQGDRIPYSEHFTILPDEGYDIHNLDAEFLFKGKKVILFGLPGAFTTICSNKHLPEYATLYDTFKSKGIDAIYCTAVNDPFVMRAWSQNYDIENKVVVISDGDGSFHKKIGLTQTIPALGERSLRYSMYVDDGVVRVLNIEEPGPSSYKISGPNHMLKDLEQLGI